MSLVRLPGEQLRPFSPVDILFAVIVSFMHIAESRNLSRVWCEVQMRTALASKFIRIAGRLTMTSWTATWSRTDPASWMPCTVA